MLRRWIAESGVSRGISTSFRSSFSATDAARWIKFDIAPEAIVPSVPIEHGQMTYASTFAEPLAYGAFQSCGSYTVTFPPSACSSRRASVSSRESRGLRYSSVASTSRPALDAQIPSSTSASASTSTSRAAYGAPEAPVIPRKTRTRGPLSRTLGCKQEVRQLPELLVAERAELRHHGIAELRRVADVRHQVLPGAAFGSHVAEIGRAQVGGTRAQIRVARRAAGLGEDSRAGESRLVVLEALALGPLRHRRDDLAGERLPRRRALVGQHAHRQHDEHGRDDGDG